MSRVSYKNTCHVFLTKIHVTCFLQKYMSRVSYKNTCHVFLTKNNVYRWKGQIFQIYSKFSNWYRVPNLGWVSEFLKNNFLKFIGYRLFLLFVTNTSRGTESSALRCVCVCVWGGGGGGSLWEECVTVCIHASFIVLKSCIFKERYFIKRLLIILDNTVGKVTYFIEKIKKKLYLA